VGPTSIQQGKTFREDKKGQCCKNCINFFDFAMLALSHGKPNSFIKPNMQALRTEMIKDTCVVRHELGPNNRVPSNGVDG